MVNKNHKIHLADTCFKECTLLVHTTYWVNAVCLETECTLYHVGVFSGCVIWHSPCQCHEAGGYYWLC